MKIIKRRLYQEIKDHLLKKEISLVIGARQVGKTTLLKEIERELKQKEEKTLWLSLDYEADSRHFVSQNDLLAKIRLECGSGPAYIFIDEIQRKKDAGVFLKGLYDLNLPYKFLVSGSGSLELKEKIHESLAGRKKIFELLPVSFLEFVNFRTDYRYSEKLNDFFLIEKEQARKLLNEYLNFGGYPRVVLAETITEKREIIKEIYTSYLEKDIFYLLKIDKSEAFSMMLRILAGLDGKILNYSKIAAAVNISIITLRKYLDYAEKTFVIYRLQPFFGNAKKEIIKAPVVYFNDLGLRNFSAGLFGKIETPEESAFPFQNLVTNIIREKTSFDAAEVLFWRTADGAEVDNVIRSGNNLIAVETKYSELKRPEVSRSFRNFLDNYQPSESYIINLSLNAKEKIAKTELHFKSIFNWLS